MPCPPSDPPPIPVAWLPPPRTELSPTPPPKPRSATPRRPEPAPLPPRPGRLISACAQYFASTPTAAGWARRHTADILTRWNVPELADDALLVVSELVGNAVLHTGTGQTPAACRLVLKLFVEAVAVEVWDLCPDADFRPQETDVLSESGRGLAIVAALCGTPPLVFAEPGHGKTVVAVIPRRTP